VQNDTGEVIEFDAQEWTVYIETRRKTRLFCGKVRLGLGVVLCVAALCVFAFWDDSMAVAMRAVNGVFQEY
jgi:hypothetical protein